ncbi:MAG: hypothetical protein ACI4IL_07565 [Eubacterium sp.]
MPITNTINEDLKFIQKYYSERTGIKYSKANALRRLIIESANLIRNTGETFPNRKWELENLSETAHREYENRQKK